MKKISLLLIVAVVLGFIFILTQKSFRKTITKNFNYLIKNQIPKGKSNTDEVNENTIEKLYALFKKMEINNADIKKTILKDSTLQIRASIPLGKPIEPSLWKVCSLMQSNGFIVKSCTSKNPDSSIILTLAKDSAQMIIKFNRSSRYQTGSGQLGILIENFGFQADETTIQYLSFSEPLSVSLIPTTKLSSWTAQIADEYHKEIVILMPMEPLPTKFKEHKKNTIMVHHTSEQIKSFYTKATNAIPNYTGITNLGGERVLSDSKVLGVLFDELKRKDRIFIVNGSLKKSNVSQVAQAKGIHYIVIDKTINGDLPVKAIQDSLQHFASIAQKVGHLLISCKASPTFIKALQNEIGPLKQNGIQLVYITDLVRKKYRIQNKKNK